MNTYLRMNLHFWNWYHVPKNGRKCTFFSQKTRGLFLLGLPLVLNFRKLTHQYIEKYLISWLRFHHLRQCLHRFLRRHVHVRDRAYFICPDRWIICYSARVVIYFRRDGNLFSLQFAQARNVFFEKAIHGESTFYTHKSLSRTPQYFEHFGGNLLHLPFFSIENNEPMRLDFNGISFPRLRATDTRKRATAARYSLFENIFDCHCLERCYSRFAFFGIRQQ